MDSYCAQPKKPARCHSCTSINERNREQLTSSNATESDHHGLVERCYKPQESSEQYHAKPSSSQCPLPVPNCVAESHEAERSEHKPNVRWQSEEELGASRNIRADIEDIDHGRPDDVDAVVEHRDDEGNNKRCCEFTALVAPEEMRWAELEPGCDCKYLYNQFVNCLSVASLTSCWRESPRHQTR
jgi:hypothetical protein